MRPAVTPISGSAASSSKSTAATTGGSAPRDSVLVDHGAVSVTKRNSVRAYFLGFNFRLMVALFRESNELSVLAPLDAP